MTLEITSDNFQTDVIEAKQPVLIDFWAVWCAPCQMQGPIVEKLAQSFEGKAVVAKLDVEKAGDIASKFGVMAIPTIIIFKDGEAVERLTGLRQEPELVGLLNKHI